MSRNPNNVMTGIFDGACYWAPLTAMHPNGFDQDLTSLGYADLGFIDEAGSPTLSLPGNGDATPVRVWQRAQVIRNIRTPIDETPTFTMTLAETTVEALEAALGTTINPDGSYVINSSVERPHGCLVLDVLTAQGGRRYFAPNAVITEIGDIEFSNDGSIVGLPITVSADFDPSIDGNLRVWDTNLASNGGVMSFADVTDSVLSELA